jgi:AAA domain, putative AbiEii toxin, Type IV TA system/AAA ATPase domain
MQIRELQIENFRGISSLVWRPSSSLVCIVGSGDAGKSTILDAIEVTLSPRWLQVTDADFPGCDTTKTIEITVTVGELPEEALKEGCMGLHLRGWSKGGQLHDEPEGDDEPVASVRLTIDGSLEPVWEVVTDRAEPRALSGRDRGLFGVVRLGGDADRHLTWGHGSALARLSGEKGKSAAVLADAYRRARELVASGSLAGLNTVAQEVYEAAVSLGAYSKAAYTPGLDTQRASMSLGALALHDVAIPVRLAGLGTRRLVALAIQRLAVPEGAIVLIDELEHGLEPHRIRRVLRELRGAREAVTGQLGHVIMTTHAAVTITELEAMQLSVAVKKAGVVEMRAPDASLQAVVRRVPEAFLARRVVVCEGKTEVGLLRALRD